MSYTPPDEKKLLTVFDTAPQSVQDALTDGVAVNFFLTLEKEYRISEKAALSVTTMGRDVLIGLLQPIDFDKYLRELVGADTATRLLRDFNAKVLVPLQSEKAEIKKPSPTAGDVIFKTAPNVPVSAAPKPVPPQAAPVVSEVHNDQLPSLQSIQPPALPSLTKTGVLPPKPPMQQPVPKPAPAPAPKTMLINKYVADPYRELPDIDK